MKNQVTFSDFCDRFASHDRQNSFSYGGKQALFDYLEQLEEDTGEEIELDVVALDCEYVEYESATEAAKDYTFEYVSEEEDQDDKEREEEEACLEYFRDNTQIIEFDGGIIIQAF